LRSASTILQAATVLGRVQALRFRSGPSGAFGGLDATCAR
jgi:hypothetical protein